VWGLWTSGYAVTAGDKSQSLINDCGEKWGKKDCGRGTRLTSRSSLLQMTTIKGKPKILWTITAFIQACHWSISSATQIESTPWYPSRFSIPTDVFLSLLYHACYVLWQSHSPWYDHFNTTQYVNYLSINGMVRKHTVQTFFGKHRNCCPLVSRRTFIVDLTIKSWR
jgi:hypothetical protein